VANALFLAYLVWAAPKVTRQIIATEGWSVIALVVGFVYLGARLIGLVIGVEKVRYTMLPFAHTPPTQ